MTTEKKSTSKADQKTIENPKPIFDRFLGDVLNEGTDAIEKYLEPYKPEEVVAYAIMLENILREVGKITLAKLPVQKN